MKYLAFDLEIAAIVPEGETDWKAHRPLGITCAALARVNSDGTIEANTYCGKDENAEFTPRMSRRHCESFVQYLQDYVRNGYTLLTWNGFSFDFDVLAEESGMHAECVELATHHVDMMLHVFCVKGFPLGLNAASKGLGLAGKTEGMDGAQAPQMWADGRYGEVLEYVAQDVRSTLEVALAVEKHCRLTWIAKSGRRNNLPIPKWLTCFEALQLPEPDVSWMTGERLTREKFTAWMG